MDIIDKQIIETEIKGKDIYLGHHLKLDKEDRYWSVGQIKRKKKYTVAWLHTHVWHISDKKRRFYNDETYITYSVKETTEKQMLITLKKALEEVIDII